MFPRYAETLDLPLREGQATRLCRTDELAARFLDGQEPTVMGSLDSIAPVTVALRQSLKHPDKVLESLREIEGVTWESMLHTDQGIVHTIRLKSINHLSLVDTPTRRQWKLIGLDLNAPEAVIPHLSETARFHLFRLPPTNTANGARVSLDDCDRMGIEIPERWTGGGSIEMESDWDGQPTYDVMFSLKNSLPAWAIDTDSRSLATSVLALFMASKNELRAERRERKAAIEQVA